MFARHFFTFITDVVCDYYYQLYPLYFNGYRPFIFTLTILQFQNNDFLTIYSKACVNLILNTERFILNDSIFIDFQCLLEVTMFDKENR